MSDLLCKRLHRKLERVPLTRYPFKLDDLPENGIYFFYEVGEKWGHGGKKPRIVRVGTHRDGNFRSRIAEHYLLNEGNLPIDTTRPPPHDRSIFRKNIGRALLHKARNPFLRVWEIDFTSKESREKNGHLRNISNERRTEAKVTRLLRERFSFRFIRLEGQKQRMGTKGLEGALIGTLAHCGKCKPSESWLGLYSPEDRIRESGLWQVQHLSADPMDKEQQRRFAKAVKHTADWLKGD